MKQPTAKTTSRFVARILDRTKTPVYLVGNDYVIIYANQACAQWVGIELEQLIGAKCVYASQAQTKGPNDELNQQLEGLCPPPSCFETNPGALDRSDAQTSSQIEPSETASSNVLVSAVDQNNKTVWRPAAVCRLKEKLGDSDPELLSLIHI